MKLSELAALYDAAKDGILSDRTRKMYAATISGMIAHVGDCDAADLTVHQLRGWRSARRKTGISTATLQKDVREVRTFFRWCFEEGLIADDPSRRLRRPALEDAAPKAASVADVARVLQYIEDARRWGLEPAAQLARDKFTILFLCDTGARIGGLLSLTLDRLDLEERCAVTIEKGRGGGKQHRRYFGEHTALAARVWLHYRPPEATHQRVMCNITGGAYGRRGAPLRRNTVYHGLRKLAERAGVDGRFNPHAFRHAAAREWLKNGANLASVSRLLGHSSIEVTAGFYARWTADELQKIHKEVSYVDQLFT